MFIKIIGCALLCMSVPVISATLTDPTQPYDAPQYGDSQTTKTTTGLQLDMIIKKQQTRFAIINNTIVKEGDRIADAIVISIQADRVIVIRRHTKQVLPLLQKQNRIQISR